MLCFRGVDNESYYRLMPETPRFYMDYTGTGNTLNPVHPSVLRLIMDSLRYFVTECHVDGFRFDLASALAREFYDVDRLSAFFDVIHQDPVLSQVKLIAEPWDVGPGGYQVGNFPILWSEWNGIYRDTMRDFWRGDATVAEFASRFGGSADLYESDGRKPFASVNFITAHDGFTLRDLVSYDGKHNEANGEANRDGTDDNRSWNCGVEGPTDDPAVNALRARQQRNFLATLLLSQGVPMVLGGDEWGRSQGGNNNAWCQDNEVSWFDWEARDDELLEFTRRLIELRRDHPVFRRTRFFDGTGEQLPDVWWMRPDGRRMTRRDWDNSGARAIGAFLNGEELATQNAHGEEVRDDSFLLLFNGHFEEITFRLPARRFATRWEIVLATGSCEGRAARPGRRRPRRLPLGRAAPSRLDQSDGRLWMACRTLDTLVWRRAVARRGPSGKVRRRPGFRPAGRRPLRRRGRPPGRGRAGRASSGSAPRGSSPSSPRRRAPWRSRRSRGRARSPAAPRARGRSDPRAAGTAPAACGPVPLTNSEITRRVIDGESSASPGATTWIAPTSCSGGVSLSRKPLAPARSAS